MTCPSNRSGVTIWEGQEDNEDGEADKILDNALTISRYSMLHVTASKASNYSVELMGNFYSCQILSCINEVRLYSRRIECSGENRKLPTIFAELPYSCLHRRSWFLFSFLLIPMFAQDHLSPHTQIPLIPLQFPQFPEPAFAKLCLPSAKSAFIPKHYFSEWLCMQLIVWSKNSCSQ